MARFAIYFQDHAEVSGGLKVSPGSHLVDTSSFDETRLPYVNVPSRAGDLVCFCSRVVHSPFALRPRVGARPCFVAAPGRYGLHPRPRSVSARAYSARNHFHRLRRPSLEADLHIKNRALVNPDPARLLPALCDAQHLAESAKKSNIGIRLDIALMESAIAANNALNAGVDAGALGPLLQSFKRMCESSRDWSPHYRLFDDVPRGDTVEDLLPFLRQVSKRIGQIAATFATVHRDPHMVALDIKRMRAARASGAAQA